MEIKELTAKNYLLWDEFCLKSDDAWFWHTTSWLRYNLDYRTDFYPLSLSFIVEDNGKILAICPLFLETKATGREFTMGDIPLPVPALANDLSPKIREKVLKFIFEEVDRLARKHRVSRASFRFVTLNKSYLQETLRRRSNFLHKFGYLDCSISTQVIDLKQPLSVLRRDLRHGHDAAIAQGAKTLEAEFFDQNKLTLKIFENYVQLHQQEAKRIIRSPKTYESMYETAKRGEAFLAGAKLGAAYLGFIYFFVYKNNAYYGSVGISEQAKDIPVSHFIQWAAIEWMHKSKIEFYELGWQYFAPDLTPYFSPKQINISKFKRGFGGFTIPLFMGEKYYDKRYFLKEYEARTRQYAETIQS